MALSVQRFLNYIPHKTCRWALWGSIAGKSKQIIEQCVSKALSNKESELTLSCYTCFEKVAQFL